MHVEKKLDWLYTDRLLWRLSWKESAYQCRGVGSILGWERSLGEGNGNSLQYFCLGNPMDRGAWQVTVHGVTKKSDMTQRPNTKYTDNC